MVHAFLYVRSILGVCDGCCETDIEIMVDIGKEIRAELHQQGRTVTWLAQQLDMRRATLYAVFRKNSIDTYLLKRIGQLLNKDFFILLSADMKNDDCASASK
jgi:hypothetical protein